MEVLDGLHLTTVDLHRYAALVHHAETGDEIDVEPPVYGKATLHFRISDAERAALGNPDPHTQSRDPNATPNLWAFDSHGHNTPMRRNRRGNSRIRRAPERSK